MPAEVLLTELSERVLTLRLNRPDKKNAFNTALYNTAAEAIGQAVADPEVRVLLIAGSGNSFCSGNDMADFLADPPTDPENSPVMRFMRALAACPKPVVAAVNGPAIGIGSTLLFHCDLVYAADGARFHFPFVNIGICPEFASTLLLPAMTGHQRAAELLLLGEPFEAAKAQEIGMVNAVLPAAELETHARAQALKLARQPPNALRVSKALLKRWPQAQMNEAISAEAAQFMPMLKMPEALEAFNAFMQKRKPDFSRFE